MAEHVAQGSRVGLDRERVVRVALALLDEVGLDDLSMRRLAERLGVTAPALYWYVRDKNELLGLLADAISAEMPLPDPGRPWRTELEALARGARRVARAHRDAARILVATLPTGPHRLRAIDAVLSLLLRAGFSPADAADIAYVLNVYGVGFMLDEALGPGPQSSTPGLLAHAGVSSGDASLSALAQARLILERGAVNVTIRAEAALPTLFQMTFEGPPPEIETHEGTVRIRQRHTRRSSCDLTLTGTLPWEIHIEGGAARLTADLRALQVSSLHVTGGVTQMRVQLAQPVGTVPVRIDGGVNKLHIERPSTAAMRLYVHRGSSHITLDGVRLNAVGGGTDWASPDYASASDRYNLEFGGAASDVSLGAPTQEVAATADDPANLNAQMRDWFAAQPPSEYPSLVALAGKLAHPDQDRRFEMGLQMMLDGLERRLAAASGPVHGSGDGE
jgi:TetR/AcrR family tetracycline transcriptional repressor